MPAQNICPHCGAPLPAHDRPAPIPDELEPPAVELLAFGSNDEAFVSNSFGRGMASAQDDPILGGFIAPSSSGSRESSAAIADRPESPPYFPSIIVERPSPASKGSAREEDDEEEQPEPRITWPSILLMSYASAITLALTWTLWRTPRGQELPREAITHEAPPTVGRQAGLSRKVAPAEPIVGNHLIALKNSLQVGSLEVAPLEVRREQVVLQRTNLSGKVDRKDGGKNALVLRLRLRNTSKDAVFAPLDQSYLREQEKEIVDSYLETGAGERVYPFPLAVESEWSIVGQEFGELRPGEARIVSVVSAPDAPGDEAGPFTWRVRLRTGIGRNDIIGVRWPESAPARPK